MIYLEGMGVLGSFIAMALEAEGLTFAWGDDESKINSWQACTGAVYPSGYKRDMEGYRAFVNNCVEYGYSDFIERASFWYMNMRPPHYYAGEGESYLKLGRHRETQGNLHRHDMDSYHINAQAFVLSTRERFKGNRVDSSSCDTKIVAHGFAKATRYVWGWAELVEYRSTLVTELRPAIYIRPSYNIGYLYPVPNTPYWYLGSALQVQREPKTLEVGGKPAGKIELLKRYLPQADEIIQTGIVKEGWRPSLNDKEEDLNAPLAVREGNTITVRPLWNSGVRWSQLVVKEVLNLL